MMQSIFSVALALGVMCSAFPEWAEAQDATPPLDLPAPVTRPLPPPPAPVQQSRLPLPARTAGRTASPMARPLLPIGKPGGPDKEIKASACECPTFPLDDDEPATRHLVVFTAKWCKPCQKMAPVITRLKKQGHPIIHLDIDTHPKAVQCFGIDSIPAFIVMEGQKETQRVLGVCSESRLTRLLGKGDHSPLIAHLAAHSQTKPAPANRVQIICNKMELEFDPRSRQHIIHCSGGVTVKSAKFEVKAERMIIRDSRMLFEGSVGMSLNGPTPAAKPKPPAAASGIRIHFRQPSPSPFRKP